MTAGIGLAVVMFSNGSGIATPKAGGLRDLAFVDAAGSPRTIASLAGKATMINVWATWCAPCRKEMPALASLQADLGGERFQVVTLSIDRTGNEAVRPFFEEIGIHNLEVFLDPTMSVMPAAGIVGLPTTILVDAKGEEVYRWVGPRAWDSPEARAALALYLDSGAVAQLELPSSQ